MWQNQHEDETMKMGRHLACKEGASEEEERYDYRMVQMS
jgi:hypothetical protein